MPQFQKVIRLDPALVHEISQRTSKQYLDLHSFELSPAYVSMVLSWSQKDICVYFDAYQNFKSIRFLLSRSLYEATDSYTELRLIIDNVI